MLKEKEQSTARQCKYFRLNSDMIFINGDSLHVPRGITRLILRRRFQRAREERTISVTTRSINHRVLPVTPTQYRRCRARCWSATPVVRRPTRNTLPADFVFTIKMGESRVIISEQFCTHCITIFIFNHVVAGSNIALLRYMFYYFCVCMYNNILCNM